MCGRVRTPNEIREIKIELRIKHDRIGDLYAPRFNVAPTTQVPVVTSTNGERTLEWMRWGLVPSWSKEIGKFATFNARADTLAAKPSFRGAWKAGRRCLVVTDGFYEWRQSDKKPFAIALGNKQPMLMAGLWDEWKPKDAEPVKSFTIITTEANAMMAPVHDRMPVILGAEDWAAWLGEEPLDDPASLLKPFPPERMTMWPVGKAVGSVKNQGTELAERVNA